MSPLASSQPIRAAFRKCGLLWNRTPLTALLVYVLLSILLRENYPFSHFPMYASPSPERHFIRVTSAEGELLPIYTLTGVTAPKVGKIYRKKTEEEARRQRIRPFDLPHEHRETIGREVLAYLRAQATRMQQNLPDRMQLAMIFLSIENGSVQERPEVIVTE